MTGSACTLLSIDVNITLNAGRSGNEGNNGDSDKKDSRKMRRLYNDCALRPIFTGTKTKTKTVATARGVGDGEREVSVWCTHTSTPQQAAGRSRSSGGLILKRWL